MLRPRSAALVPPSRYEAIEQGLAPQSETVADAEGNVSALVYPAERPAAAPLRPDALSPPAIHSALLLDPLPAQRPIRIIRPSTVEQPVNVERVLATRLEESLDPETARLSGTALHALLQHLQRLEPAERANVAARALEVLLPTAPEQHARLATRAISILTRPELAHLFGPNSRPEVPFFAEAKKGSENVRLIGRVDRLVVEPDRVLVIDFKSDANAPTTADAVPAAYLTQLGLYALVATQLFPGLRVDAAILWTSLESLLELPRDALMEATRSFTMR